MIYDNELLLRHNRLAEKTYNQLFFNSVAVLEKDGSIMVAPNFLCPKCGDQKNASSRPTAKLSTEKRQVLLSSFNSYSSLP
jgi:hypothetical protein